MRHLFETCRKNSTGVFGASRVCSGALRLIHVNGRYRYMMNKWQIITGLCWGCSFRACRNEKVYARTVCCICIYVIHTHRSYQKGLPYCSTLLKPPLWSTACTALHCSCQLLLYSVLFKYKWSSLILKKELEFTTCFFFSIYIFRIWPFSPCLCCKA
jgi:hypothetical protein